MELPREGVVAPVAARGGVAGVSGVEVTPAAISTSAAPEAAGWHRSLVLVVFVLLAAVAGALPEFTLGANLMIFAVGAPLFWIGLSRAEPKSPQRIRPATRAARWWIVPAGLLIVAEVATFTLGSTHDYPTLSKLVDPWLDRYPVRAGAFLGWLAAFWALVRR